MPCEVTPATLLDFSNGEVSALRAWTVRRHLAACPACTAEIAALQDFQAALRRADLVPPEPAPSFVPPHRLPLRRALAAAIAAVLVGSLFLFPALRQSRPNIQNPGAAIAAALGRVNTWHFSGWKLIDGKRVPWEVWGRRAPFLYYEQLGDTLTWSDGKQRRRIFAPNPALKRPQGLLIKNAVTDTTAYVGFQADPAYQSLVSDQVKHGSFGDVFTTLYAQTPAVAEFRRQWAMGNSGVNENKLYTISKQDWLPMTYQLHFDNPKFARDTEHLSVRYDVDLPDYVVNPPSPDSYSVIDFTQTATEAAAPSGSHLADCHGFQVQAEPVGMDKEGNVLIAVRGWLGGNRLLKDTTFTLNVSPFDQTFYAQRGVQKIKYLYASNSSVPPGDSFYLPFMPLDVIQALPDTLALDLSASPEVRVRDSDVLDSMAHVHSMTTTESLFTANFHWRLSLPAKPVASILALLPPDQRQYLQAPGQILRDVQQQFPNRAFEYALAEQRREYYYMGYDYIYNGLKIAAPHLAATGVINPNGTLSPNIPGLEKVEAVRKAHPEIFEKAKQKFRERAVYWQKRKLALLPTGGSTHEERENNLIHHLYDVQSLAICYQNADDRANCNKTLRQLIRECQPLPEQGGLLRRQAEFALRTGRFPGDADYKGPA